MSEFAIFARVASLVRAALLALLAVSLSLSQTYVDYSEWLLAWAVMASSIFSRFLWIPGAIIGWLLALYLLPPALIAWVKAFQ